MQNIYIEKIKKIKNKYKGIELTGIVGSYARGAESEKSDIDILYKTEDTCMYEADLFQKELGKNVDLTDVTTLNSFAKKYMLQDKIDV